MSLCFVPADTLLYSQGSIGDYFYIIKQGQLNLLQNTDVVKTLMEGESFGELALLHGAPRSGSARTFKDCHFWCLDRKVFREIIDQVNNSNFEENKKFIQSIPILNIIENEQKAILCSNLLKEIHEPGDYIVRGKFERFLKIRGRYC